MNDISKAKHITTSDGLKIYYWVNHQKGQGDEFAVISGAASMNHSALLDIEKGLNERGRSTIVFDVRGVGHSDAPGRSEFYKLNLYSDDLARILQQEGIEKPKLVGYSTGFMPAVDYAVKTDNADSIIGICASYDFSETAVNPLLFELYDKFFRNVDYVGSAGMNVVNKIKGKTRGYPDQSQLKGKNNFRTWLSMVDVPFEKIDAHIASGREITKWNISPQLSNLEIPLLLIYGSNDKLVRPIAGEYIKQIYGSDLEIEILKGAHSLPLKTPDEVLTVINDYLFK